MKILFCNIAYMLHYEGNTSRDITPTGAGQWVKENADAHEKWNFLNYDGYCYGFVQNPGQFHLERFSGISKSINATDGVTIIWCAPLPSGKTVIVGWYKNATMFRDYQISDFTPVTGIDRFYFAKAKSEDCYLLPESLRIFEIERAAKAGKGKGFGQQNYWYAESEYAQKTLIPKVLEFMEAHKQERINRLDDFFAEPSNINEPLTEEEQKKADFYYDSGLYDDYLPLGYRSFATTKFTDDAFFIAASLRALHQFKRSVEWYEKVLQIEGDSWDVLTQLVYLYQQVKQHAQSTQTALKLLTYPDSKDSTIRDELHCIIADNYMYQNNIIEAIKWLDIILKTSIDEALIEHTKSTKEAWSELL